MSNQPEVTPVYHERQRLQLCLLHALNNLLQGEKAFTRKELDEIADRLQSKEPGIDGWHPLSMIFKRHRNSLTGDYDVNVLFAALADRGKVAKWHDRRKAIEELDLAEHGGRFVGIVANVPKRRYGGMWESRHWVALRIVNGLWYNLDSDLQDPLIFENGEDDLKKYLESVISDTGEVLIVTDEVIT